MVLGSVHTEYQCQYCNVASDITLIKLLKFLNKPIQLLQNGLQPQLIRYDVSIDADASNQSLTLGINGPL